jgi:hypothetical protein
LLRVQSQQLPTESQVLECEVLPGTESAYQPAEEMSERYDHGKNFTGKIRIELCAKSFILQVYDVLAKHNPEITIRHGHAKAEEANGGAGEAQGHFPETCEPTGGESAREDQPNSSRVGELLCGRACREMFHVYQRLGGKKDSATSDARAETQRVRLEAME